MGALIARSEQAVSITDLVRSFKSYVEKLVSGQQDRYVVMRNNKPAVVMLQVEEYECLIEELDDLRIERIAASRRASPVADDDLLSHEEMRSRLCSDEDD